MDINLLLVYMILSAILCKDTPSPQVKQFVSGSGGWYSDLWVCREVCWTFMFGAYWFCIHAHKLHSLFTCLWLFDRNWVWFS